MLFFFPYMCDFSSDKTINSSPQHSETLHPNNFMLELFLLFSSEILLQTATPVKQHTFCDVRAHCPSSLFGNFLRPYLCYNGLGTCQPFSITVWRQRCGLICFYGRHSVNVLPSELYSQVVRARTCHNTNIVAFEMSFEGFWFLNFLR